MGLKFAYEDGQTPLDEDEKHELIIKTISTQGELNEFEQKISKKRLNGVFVQIYRLTKY